MTFFRQCDAMLLYPKSLEIVELIISYTIIYREITNNLTAKYMHSSNLTAVVQLPSAGIGEFVCCKKCECFVEMNFT